jgi:hypothetical protein
MTPKRTYKIADSLTFMGLAADAMQKGYNRQLDLEQLAKNLDFHGVGVVSFAMVHEHIAGEKVAPHMRTMWMIPLKSGPKDFETVTLDVSMENFDNLKEVAVPG